MNSMLRNMVAAGLLLAAGGTARAQEIVIGVPMALTGPYAFVGVPIRNGIVQALEEANARKALAPATIRIVQEDTASEKGQAITLTNKLNAVDKALMMLGPTSSIEALAAAPVANDVKMPMLTSAVSSDILKAGPWSYKITAAPSDIMTELGKFAVEKVKARKTVYVFNRDNDGFVAQKNVFRDVLKAAGGAVVSEEAILGSDTDFVALSTKIATSGADSLFIASPAEQGANIVIQARQAGLPETVAILAPPSMASQAFIKTGGKAVEGAYIVADYFAGSATAQNKAFVEAYKARYKTDPDNWAAVGYALGLLAVDVIKAAGPGASRQAVIDAFGKVGKTPTVLGDGSFELDAARAPHYGAAILAVKNGVFVDATK